MKLCLLVLISMVTSSLAQSFSSPTETVWKSTWNADEKAAAEFLHVAEYDLLKARERDQIASWAYATNITNHNDHKKWEAEVRGCMTMSRRDVNVDQKGGHNIDWMLLVLIF